MYHRPIYLLLIMLVLTKALPAQQPSASGAGKLFIIGGGHCPPSLWKVMVETARLGPTDYVAVLPMSSAYPDTSFLYFSESLSPVCQQPIVFLNFTATQVNDKVKLDSLEKAKLVFITGGDQARFMSVVANTPVQAAIRKAFDHGSVIAGTSAGAAVMSERMITGNQLKGDTSYRSTFPKLIAGNIEFSMGLGLLNTAIIDQHFVVRSRYNRLLSALQAFPQYACIGIDESTAIIVSGKNVTIAGEGQVIVLSRPVALQAKPNGLLTLRDLQFSIFAAGDHFRLP